MTRFWMSRFGQWLSFVVARRLARNASVTVVLRDMGYTEAQINAMKAASLQAEGGFHRRNEAESPDPSKETDPAQQDEETTFPVGEWR